MMPASASVIARVRIRILVPRRMARFARGRARYRVGFGRELTPTFSVSFASESGLTCTRASPPGRIGCQVPTTYTPGGSGANVTRSPALTFFAHDDGAT